MIPSPPQSAGIAATPASGLLILLVVVVVAAASSSSTRAAAFSIRAMQQRQHSSPRSRSSPPARITMDSGEDFAFVKVPLASSSAAAAAALTAAPVTTAASKDCTRNKNNYSCNCKLPLALEPSVSDAFLRQPASTETEMTTAEGEGEEPMPWKSSIDPSQEELTFMPFWNLQMDVMNKQLPGLKSVPVTNKDGTVDFSFASSSSGTTNNNNNKSNKKSVRVANACFSSTDFRKIRMTYYDAGTQAQVYNSLWYPDPAKYPALPVLGIDLLRFHGGKKHLFVIDFQPLVSDEQQDADGDHREREQLRRQARSHEETVLKPIRDRYHLLQGRMSQRFYDESQFFSSQVLFGRLDGDPAGGVVWDQVWPAFQECLRAYLDLIDSTAAATTTADPSTSPLDRQRAYDVYSANRDPALHMFRAKFGDKWADEYVHEFLFDLSR